MHSNPNNQVTDPTGRTFLERCAEMGLCAWRYEDGGLSLQNTNKQAGEAYDHLIALTEQISANLEDITRSGDPVTILDALSAAWVPEPTNPNAGFIVAPNAQGGPMKTDLVTAKLALGWTLQDLSEVGQSEYAVEDMAEQLGQCYENIAMLYDIGRSMRTIDQPKIMAQGIVDQMCASQGYGWSAIRMVVSDQGVPGMEDACIVTGRLECDRDLFHQLTGILLANWDDRNWSKLLQVKSDPVAELVGGEVILEPIRLDGRVIGVVMAGGKTGPEPEATSGDTQLLDAIAGFIGALHENASRLTEQKNMFIGSLQAVSAALDAKDRYTHGHSERVAWLGTQLAQTIGLNAETVDRIRISGLVHDVGKIGVPEAVLCKTGRLTDEEFDQIKKHPRIGYNILKGIPKMDDVLDGVLYHHERWDGRGYPTKLAGEDIPLYGRILAVADTFDAMSSTRSYRKAMPREKVLAEILNCAGSQFDPSLTEPFVALDLAEYDRIVARHQGDSVPQEDSQDQDRAA